MGTPEFAVPTLAAVAASCHQLVAVFTRAPAKGGRRGLRFSKTPVHLAADSFGASVYTPPTLRNTEAQGAFRSLSADVAVVVAYGLILPISILGAPRLGCINLHASLLPRWRGAAPIQRAVMAGDAQTGVEVMRMEVGLDTGPTALREIVPISPQDTAGDLATRLAPVAAKLAVSALQSMETGSLEFHEQSTVGVSYAHKIEKSETEIDWTQSAEGVRNEIHGLSPAPGARSKILIGGLLESIKILRVEVTTGEGPPGALLSEGMSIACGTGAIRVLQAQRSGKNAMGGDELMRGAKLAVGVCFMPSLRAKSASHAKSEFQVRKP